MLENMPQEKPKTMGELVPGGSPEAVDLMSKLLCFNPYNRLTAEQALRHPFVSQFTNPEDEPILGRTVTIPIDDNVKYSMRDYRDKLYGEIVKRKKELRQRMRDGAASQKDQSGAL